MVSYVGDRQLGAAVNSSSCTQCTKKGDSKSLHT